MLGEAITKEQLANGSSDLIRKLSHEASLVATVTMAFSTDPVARWVYPKAVDYFRWFPSFVRAFAGQAIDDGSALFTTNYSGVALWLKPGAHPDEEALVRLVEDSLPKERHTELFELFEKMGDGHPEEDHWYLPMIGVDTYRQNLGIGSGLMKLASERSDGDGLPLYLESSNPRNISLYIRSGYEVLSEICVADSPPLTRMIRQAK